MSAIEVVGGRIIRSPSFGIIGFGEIAQAHCRYLIAEGGIDISHEMIVVFPGIHDWFDAGWPHHVSEKMLARAIRDAKLVFVDERVATIQPVPGHYGGYVVETSHQTYEFRDIYLEPAHVNAA